MRMRALLTLTCIWLAGCGSKLDFATSGAGCEAAETVAGSKGRCPGERLACRMGSVDRDGLSANGCEERLMQSKDYTLYALNRGGSADLTMNGYTLALSLTGGWAAISGPACTASANSPCHYDLIALQIGFPAFIFDSLSWTDGLLVLPKPAPMVDYGTGLVFPSDASLVASFTVEGSKRIVSAGGVAMRGLIVIDGRRMAFRSDHLQMPFGGYTMDRLSILIDGKAP